MNAPNPYNTPTPVTPNQPDAGSGHPTPESLPPEQRRVANEMLSHMPDGRGPVGEERQRSHVALGVLSGLIFVSFVVVIVAAGRDFSTVFAVGLITLAYAIGLLPLYGAAWLRRRDRATAVARAQRVARQMPRVDRGSTHPQGASTAAQATTSGAG